MSAAPDSWFHEKESAWLYRRVAAAEHDSARVRLFTKLAEAAEAQAGLWQAAAPESRRVFVPRLRARVVALLVAGFGARRLRPVLAAMKLRGLSVYGPPVPASGHPMPTSVAEVTRRHQRAAGGNLRAAVFGINDGLVSNASLVMGVAGAGSSGEYVMLTGAAGLLAGALSMAAGEYVSVRSQRDLYEYQIGLERRELAEYPEEEIEELALIYEARGVPLGRAREMSRTLLADPAHALDTMAREELGLNPDDLGSPFGAAAFSFGAFAVGAAIPLAPLLAGVPAARAIVAVAALTLLALCGVGLALSLFTGRGAWRGALRMVAIGGGAGLLSFLVGRLLGVALS
ncbi:MAG: VIT1/CCC1 transporter family protein [Gammaproteobacteria bacterium]|nr:VIT1/CCC1 transporter family protein [Gammaproteobacteria bacterium]